MSSTSHANNYGWNGVNWDKIHATTSGHLKVNVENALAIDTSGLATDTLQTSGNASLSSIDGKISACDTGAVVVSSSALPSGASTSANQTSGNSLLSSINGNITACDTGAVVVSSSALPSGASTSVNQTTANGLLTNIDANITTCNTGAVVVSSSALPSGGATSALQTSGNASLTELEGSLYAEGDSFGVSDKGVMVMGRNGTNAAKPIHITNNGDVEVEIADFIKGQTTMASSFPVVVSSDQSTLATDPVDTRTSGTLFSAQVIADGNNATSSVVDLDGYKYLQILGNTTNTIDSVATFEWSVNNTNWYKSGDEYIPLDYSSGDFSFIRPNASARYVRFYKANNSGASETITLVYALRKN